MINLNNLCKNSKDIKKEIWRNKEINYYVVLDVLGDSCSQCWFKYDSPETQKLRDECSRRGCGECRKTTYKQIRQAFIDDKKNNLGVW